MDLPTNGKSRKVIADALDQLLVYRYVQRVGEKNKAKFPKSRL